jgi:hypothetical protein
MTNLPLSPVKQNFLPSLFICGVALLVVVSSTVAWADAAPAAAATNSQYPDFYSGKNIGKDKDINWVNVIRVSAPPYGSDIDGKGNTTVTFSAPGMTKVKVMCWQQPTPANPNKWGHDQVVAANVKLDADGNGSFDFPADEFPNGPITIRIYAKDDQAKQDVCELQLYNQGGVVWNQGIPKTDPPGADGMQLLFSDDFDGPLSISADGTDAKYESHKTGGGDFSGWPFSNNEGDNNPFAQEGSYLRIHATKKANGQSSSGILSSAHEDGGGVYASAPCYFECRFLAQSAPGTWPAFWLLTKNCLEKNQPPNSGCDELDVIEAYGGQGPGNPNFPGYAATTHYWNQKDANGKPLGSADGLQVGYEAKNIPMMDLGSDSTWSTTFHTYGVKITKTDTTYYFDNMPVFQHSTKGMSANQPLWFLINYAIGGISGWKIDLDRYNNSTDMWVDYVRVYQGDQ